MLVWKTIRELGPARSLAYLVYQALKRAGVYRLMQPPGPIFPSPAVVRPEIVPPRTVLEADDPVRARVRTLLDGRTTIFGAVVAPLDFTASAPLSHWTAYDRGLPDGRDIRFAWEPARFGWAGDLVRVFTANRDARLPAFLAGKWAEFIRDNPPYRGPHWASGQEVALRLIHLVFADAALGGAIPGMAQVIAVHAARIPPTLLYARAQDNNHLLSEAAGLFTAAVALPDHPRAAGWRRLGWRTFNRAVLAQFTPAGEYTQHSANYHRLALQLAAWTDFTARGAGLAFPQETADRLAAATRWLLALCDPDTGRVPNLGPNDGAQLLPLTSLPHEDFRPLLQAAGRRFLGSAAFEPGPWDETGDWLGAGSPLREMAAPDAPQAGMLRLDHPALPSRAFLRAAAFEGRPGHADQLHVDLWFGSLNVALDPGTYSYNAAPPWDNALQSAHHHNTITIDGLDQMTRAGRFRYVDRAQAVVLETGPARAAAEHDGYRKLGLIHRRTVEAVPGGWRVADRIEGRAGSRRVRLHWLLPDWPWQVEGACLILRGPDALLTLEIAFPEGLPPEIALARAGKALLGPPPPPTMGWHSPTYGVKEPALSFAMTILAEPPVLIESWWRFRENGP